MKNWEKKNAELNEDAKHIKHEGTTTTTTNRLSFELMNRKYQQK